MLRPPRLIGRDAEWAQLQDAWQAGHAIVVIGEGGLGKTRLIGDLVRANAPRPGQTVQVRFADASTSPAANQPGTLTVPEAAVLRRGELTAVYVAQAQQFMLRAVRPGASQGGRTEVLAGLKAGERIAIDAIKAGLAGAQP